MPSVTARLLPLAQPLRSCLNLRLSKANLPVLDGFDRDLDGLAADGDLDLDLRISEVYLVTSAVAAADDGKLTETPTVWRAATA
jgi:hypothetical protein